MSKRETIKRILRRCKEKTKHILKRVDEYMLFGVVHRYREGKRDKEARFRAEHPEEFYDAESLKRRRFRNGKKIKLLCEKQCSTADIFLAQYPGGDYSTYKNYGAAPRFLAIDEYYGKNDFGFDLYKRMQLASGFDWTSRFHRLIDSYQEAGFDKAHPIELSRDHIIMDGAHRLALAMYHGEEFVPVRIYDCPRDSMWDKGWFWEQGFSREECAKIAAKTQQCLTQTLYNFVGVIWSPAQKFFDEIIQDIRQLYPNEVSVVKVMDMSLSRMDFEGFMRAVYHTDILDEYGIKQKTDLIANSTLQNGGGENIFPVRVFMLHIENPKIGTNNKNYSPQSMVVKRIKQVIRTRYRNQMAHYEYDVIMHISDNYIQSKFCRIVTEMDKNIAGLFEQLNRFNYAVVKSDGRLAETFPYYYYYYSDVDVVIAEEEMKDAVNLSENWLKEKYEREWVSVRTTEKDGTYMVCVMVRDFMMLCVHFQTVTHFQMPQSFNACVLEAKATSSNGIYQIAHPKHDALIRAYEYMRKPHKVWHRQYLEQHYGEIDRTLLHDAYGENEGIEKAIGQIYDELERSI